MPYVLRNSDGLIIAVSQEQVDSVNWAHIEKTDSAYMAYLDDALGEANLFRDSDIQLARVLEDLITLLIERDLVRFTDFPEPAQKRLIERQSLRMHGQRLKLIDDENIII